MMFAGFLMCYIGIKGTEKTIVELFAKNPTVAPAGVPTNSAVTTPSNVLGGPVNNAIGGTIT